MKRFHCQTEPLGNSHHRSLLPFPITAFYPPPSPTGYSKVGRRVRSRRRVDSAYGAKNAGGGKVPRERALVPTGAALRPWRRDIPDSA